MSYIQIETNDGEKRVITTKDHEKMIKKWGDKLPYMILKVYEDGNKE